MSIKRNDSNNIKSMSSSVEEIKKMMEVEAAAKNAEKALLVEEAAATKAALAATKATEAAEKETAAAKTAEEASKKAKKESLDQSENTAKAIKSLGELPAALSKNFTQIQTGLTNIKAANDSAGEVSVSLSDLTDVASGVTSSVAAMSGTFAALEKAMGNTLPGPLKIVAELLVILYQTNDEFRESIDEVIQTLITGFQPIMETIGEIMELLAPILGDIIKQVAELAVELMPVIDRILEFAAGLLKELLPAIKPILDIILDLVGVLIDVLIPIFDLVCDFLLGTVFDAIKFILRAFTDIFSAVFEKLTYFADFISKLLNGDFKGAFKSFLGFLYSSANSIVTFFVTIIQFCINSFATILNYAIDFLNAFIKLLNKIPGVNIGLIGKIDWSNATSNWKLPEMNFKDEVEEDGSAAASSAGNSGGANLSTTTMAAMATGGIVTGTTIAMIGEGKYPEAVVPLGDSPQFTSMKADIANAVIQAMRFTAGNTAQSTSKDEVVLNIDGQSFARLIMPKLKKEGYRRGYDIAVKGV